MAFIDFSREYPNVADTNYTVAQRMSELLNIMGLNSALKGHAALKAAVEILYKHPDYLYGIVKKLYPAIAEQLGGDSNSSKIERAIRHSISIMKSKKTEGFKLLFPDPGLTNAELISVLYETVHFNE